MSAATDAELLAFAAENKLLIVSHDVSTMPPAASVRLAVGQPITGLLLAPQLTPIGEIIDDIILIWASSELEEWLNQVRFLPM